MDRFIDIIEPKKGYTVLSLKSNMDRFIEAYEMFMQEQKFRFKIQYG